MPFTPIVPKGSAPPLAPYSPGAKAGNTVYVSGTLAMSFSLLFCSERRCRRYGCDSRCVSA